MASWHVVPTSSSSRWHLWYMWTSVSKHIVTCLYRKICLYRIIHLRVQLYMSRYVCIHIVFFKAIETPNKCDDDHLIFSIYLECTVKIYIINSFVMYTYIVNIYIVNRYIYSSHTYIYIWIYGIVFWMRITQNTRGAPCRGTDAPRCHKPSPGEASMPMGPSYKL